MKELLNKMVIQSKVIVSFVINSIAYLLLILSFIFYIYEVKPNDYIPKMKEHFFAIMLSFIIICITRLLLKKYIQFALTGLVTLSFSKKAIPLLEKIISEDYRERYDIIDLTGFKSDIRWFRDTDIKNALISILIIEIIFIILKKLSNNYNKIRFNQPKSSSQPLSTSEVFFITLNKLNNNYSDYNNPFNRKKFNPYSFNKYVGNDNMGRKIYKDDVTGKYTTVENISNEIVDESYTSPYYTPDSNDDYYNSSYNNSYNNSNDSYVGHNYGFDNYNNYSDYYSDSLNSYMNDDF